MGSQVQSALEFQRPTGHSQDYSPSDLAPQSSTASFAVARRALACMDFQLCDQLRGYVPSAYERRCVLSDADAQHIGAATPGDAIQLVIRRKLVCTCMHTHTA